MNLPVCFYLSLFNMDIKSQNVIDYHGDNAIFMVWNFKNDIGRNEETCMYCRPA